MLIHKVDTALLIKKESDFMVKETWVSGNMANGNNCSLFRKSLRCSVGLGEIYLDC